jgi:hypothetical protein
MEIENGTYKNIVMYKGFKLSDKDKHEGKYNVEIKDGKARVHSQNLFEALECGASRWNKLACHGGSSVGRKVTGAHYALTVNGKRVHFYVKLEDKESDKKVA